MLLLAYIVVLKQRLRVFMSPPVLVVTLALGAGGTLLLFRTASVTVIGFMERRRGIYLRNLNMFILRQMGSRINTSYVTMALVCLMLFISLSAVFTGMGMSSAILQEAGEWAEDAAASATMVSYLAVYLGVVFMIAAAAVLAIGQLSDASDNAARYGLLRKLGAEERMISRAFFTQTLIYFAAPTIPALVHTAVAMRMFEGQLTILIGSGGGESGMLAAAAALAVYIGYFIAAYRGGRAIVLTAGRG
jgi:putative ABC transport system permease protein